MTDGGQSPREIAHEIAAFLDQAKHTLDLAQYDFEFGPETAGIVGDAIRRAHARGVTIRLAYNIDHRNPIPVPPPASPDLELIQSLPVEAIAVAGVPNLMHHKYVVRDNHTVWTGSTNWTDDSWSRQENLIIVVDSPGIAAQYTANFEELASGAPVAATGASARAPIDGIRAWFTPRGGADLTNRIAQAIGLAGRRVRVCSPVISSGPILGALAGVVAKGTVDIAGCVDAVQLQGVAQQWRDAASEWKLPLLNRLAGGPLSAKLSNPFSRGHVHDSMHAKVVVADDTVFVGSFNLSRSGESNAENIVEFDDRELADQLAVFIDTVRARYDVLTIPA